MTVPMRMRILAEYADDALRLFREAGFEPSKIEKRPNHVAFEFSKVTDDRAYALATSVPRNYFAIQGVVGGPPFEN